MTPNRPVAVITGAARGIGLAVARCLAQRGSSVVLADHDVDAASQSAQSLAAQGLSALARHVDVMSGPSVDELVRQVVDQLGGMDTLVTCAGITDQQPSAGITDEGWSRMLGTHLDGTFRCCRSAYPALSRSPAPSIVTVSSVVAKMGLPGRLSYTAAKSGIEGLTRTLAVEWAADGIRVNAIAPGWTRTDQFVAASTAGIVDEGRLVAKIPLGRVAEPEEIATAVAFLASTDASYLSGQVLVVDGCASIGFST